MSDQAGIIAERIRVSGRVQGVGFRPFVWQLAQQYGLRGQIWNDAEGVMIEAWGLTTDLEAFKQGLRNQAPRLAKITAIKHIGVGKQQQSQAIPSNFSIVASETGDTQTEVAPDASVCPACLAEINDPTNRRYRYPFTNCTHCGPRLSIVKAIPYDRANTSMREFVMCEQCQAEYDDPANRRFHAQPNVCRHCGPSLWVENKRGERIVIKQDLDEIAFAVEQIKQGKILAIKGVGGFHLACDASNSTTVAELRRRKQRYAKPFALMARDIKLVKQYCHVSEEEQRLLVSAAAPIVILAMREADRLPTSLAPQQNSLGFMLPYTPLHALLLQELDVPLVMTSGNCSDQAPCIDNEQARRQLAGIADFYLMHDRDIVNRLDDSVVRQLILGEQAQIQVLRRGRGYAPDSAALPPGFENSPAILAMGAELKNTFCLLKGGTAYLSQHQGDLEDATVLADYQNNLKLYQQLYQHQPKYLALDQHPEYLSTKLGQQYALAHQLKVNQVQHHHAHIVACMAEHDLALNSEPVLGIALDGLGYGEKGQLWGGEFLLANYAGYRRLASLQAVALPGGFKAMQEPWRNTFAHLHQTLGWRWVEQHYPDNPFVLFMQEKPLQNLITMLDKNLNSPRASSAGRLFDAVAAILGLHREAVSFEGQAAMRLEVLAEKNMAHSHPYPFELEFEKEQQLWRVNWSTFWQALLDDMQLCATNVGAVEKMAARFHHTMIDVCHRLVTTLYEQYGFQHVVLTGGVMQNRILLQGIYKALEPHSLSVMSPRHYPTNDGGIALGQALVTAARYLQSDRASAV